MSDGLHKAPKFKMGGDYIFVNAKNIVGGFIIDNDPSKKSTHEEYLKYSSPLNDTTILYSIDGTIGNVALYRGEKCILGKGACYMNPNPQVLDRMFLYYELQSPRFKSYIDKMSTGSTIKHISLKTMRGYNFTFPSLGTQRQISSILKSLDDKIEVNRRINDNLEQQAQALFKSWFVDFEPFRDQPFVESELGMIPEGWRVIELEEACTIKYGKGLGKRDLTQDGFPVFGGNGIIGFYTHFLYELPQILVSCRGAASGKIIESLPKSYVTSNSLVLELKDRSYYNYIKLLLLNNPLYDYATGSAQPQITIDNIKGIKIILPLKEVINKVNYTLENIGSIQRNNNEESRRLAELRDTLLPRLMSGELSVDGLKGQFAVSPGQRPGSKEHVSNETAP